MRYRDIPFLIRFFSGIDIRLDGGCWLWKRSRGDCGYGHLRRDGKLVVASRAMWEFMNDKPVPAGKIVMHVCDNPPCVNPDHLRLGTHRDNAQDREKKGRVRRRKTDKHHNSKLSTRIVREVRRRVAAGEFQKDLAKEFHVSPSCISQANRGDSWRTVR